MSATLQLGQPRQPGGIVGQIRIGAERPRAQSSELRHFVVGEHVAILPTLGVAWTCPTTPSPTLRGSALHRPPPNATRGEHRSDRRAARGHREHSPSSSFSLTANLT